MVAPFGSRSSERSAPSPRPGELTAVDRHRCAGDERCLLGAQPAHDVSDLARSAEAAHRHRLGGETLGLGAGAFEVMSQDRSRRHDVDADCPVAVVEGGDLGQADDRRLGGDVRREVGHRRDSGDRRHVDDGAAAARQHCRDLVLHAEEGAAHVGADPAVEVVGVDVGERRGRRPIGRVVERCVETPERFEGATYESGHRGLVANVGD
jgi:hypothetical protein